MTFHLKYLFIFPPLVLILVVFLIFYSSFEIYSIIQTFVSNNLVH